jgi:hypothetical protein
MLHPIRLPSCYPALEWVVQLQRDLLAKLCEPATTAAIVTPQWVAAIRPDCTAWLEKFARRSYRGIPLLSATFRYANHRFSTAISEAKRPQALR